jgi:fermentation-respiration switch protein FrsA (DUF1100 family)
MVRYFHSTGGYVATILNTFCRKTLHAEGQCTYRDILVTETNHMDAAQAVYNWLSKHPHIDAERTEIWSVSMGSFFGLQAAAALGDQVRGAAVTFVCHEPGLTSLMNRAAPSYIMRFMYMSGYSDEDEFDRFIERFNLMPIVNEIKCPILIQAGEDDELSPLEFSDELATRIHGPKKLVIYEGERHAIGGNNLSALGENWFAMLADWCLDRVDGKPAPNERVFINSFGQASVEPYAAG